MPLLIVSLILLVASINDLMSRSLLCVVIAECILSGSKAMVRLFLADPFMEW